MRVLNLKLFSKYFASGSIAALIHFIILISLVELFFFNSTIATTIGFCIGTIANYLLQYHWTYSHNKSHAKTFTKYIIVTTCMLGVNNIVFWCQVELLSIHYVIAQIFATGIVMLLNYTINTTYTFSDKQTRS